MLQFLRNIHIYLFILNIILIRLQTQKPSSLNMYDTHHTCMCAFLFHTWAWSGWDEQGENIGFESQQIQVLIVGKSQHLFFSPGFVFFLLKMTQKQSFFSPLLCLLHSGFPIRVSFFFLHVFFFSFPTANRVVGEYKISQFRQRPNIPRELERKRERHDQPLPNRLSRLHRAFLPFSENHMKQMRITGNANSQYIQGLATSDPPACSVSLLCPCTAAVQSIYIPGSLLPAAAFPLTPADKRAFFYLFHMNQQV